MPLVVDCSTAVIGQCTTLLCSDWLKLGLGLGLRLGVRVSIRINIKKIDQLEALHFNTANHQPMLLVLLLLLLRSTTNDKFGNGLVHCLQIFSDLL